MEKVAVSWLNKTATQRRLWLSDIDPDCVCVCVGKFTIEKVFEYVASQYHYYDDLVNVLNMIVLF